MGKPPDNNEAGSSTQILKNPTRQGRPPPGFLPSKPTHFATYNTALHWGENGFNQTPVSNPLSYEASNNMPAVTQPLPSQGPQVRPTSVSNPNVVFPVIAPYSAPDHTLLPPLHQYYSSLVTTLISWQRSCHICF